MTDATPARPQSHRTILPPARTILASLVSFEALVVLYMFAGFYKGDPRFAWIPVDATGLFFALSVVAGCFILVFNPIYKKGLPLVFAMVCLVTWFLVSLMWSPSQVYGPTKVFYMTTLVLWAVIAGALIIAPDPERVRRLFGLLLLLAVWMGVEALVIYSNTGHTAINVGSTNYLMLGRACSLGALISLVAWLNSRGRVAGWICLSLFVGLGFVLAVGGGRGPLLATALTLLIPIALGVRLTTRRILYSRTLVSVTVLVLAVAGGLALYIGVTGNTPETFERLERLLTGIEENELRRSEGRRVTQYANAIDLWSQAPLLGHGAGSFPLLTGRADIRRFPHNMFLEVLVETGLVGLVFLVALLATALRPVSLERLRRDPQALCAVMLFAGIFLDCMLSGDIPDNRVLFLLMGMLTVCALPQDQAQPRPVSFLRQPHSAPPAAAAARRHPDLASPRTPYARSQ